MRGSVHRSDQSIGMTSPKPARTQRKEVTAVKRLAFLGVGSAIILGLGVTGASPAFADNGPHVATSGNTTVDRCAGCHRAHTAQASYLLKTDQTLLCGTCHGSGAPGSTTDVINGVSTAVGGGSLRGGGFTNAAIATTTGVNRTSVGVLATPVTTTSKHDVGATGTAWGGGASGTGTSMELECGSCHDPHGNGNWRILRPVAEGGTALSFPATVAVTSVTKNATLSSGTTYYYDVVTAAANTYKVTNPVTFYGTTGGADALIGATVKVVTDTTHFTVSMRSVNFASATGGSVGYADPKALASASGDGTTMTYKAWNLHGLVVGQKVTISGFTPAGYNVTAATITAVPSTTTFSVAGTEQASVTVAGSLSGIPDALSKVYTTANYWQVDDHNYTGSFLAATTGTGTAASGGATAFIANVSQWCSTCHSRILAGSGAWDVNSGDSMYKFEHRSNNGKEGSPNCIQCHVAHGTNASATGTYSSAAGTEITGHADDSFLLRVDNRGTCNMCHNL
jgi:predicted CXXCH cytochrome family protein